MTDLEFQIFKAEMKRRMRVAPFAYLSDEIFDQQAAYSRARIEKEGIPFEQIMGDLAKIK